MSLHNYLPLQKRLRTISVIALVCTLITKPASVFAWGNVGHETVVAVALKFDPDLEPRLGRILAHLSESQEWKELMASGYEDPATKTQKPLPKNWISRFERNAMLAATFPDAMRSFTAYKSDKYEKWHYYDTDYDDVQNLKFVQQPNALQVLPNLFKELKSPNAGNRAWALCWILHIVGDLHQPLHTTTRPLSTGKGDEGGKLVAGPGNLTVNLHKFWDELPNAPSQNNPMSYAGKLIVALNTNSASIQQDFVAHSKDLDPNHWIKEGHDAIVQIGYPMDNKVPDYLKAAEAVAASRLLLAGARLAKLLDHELP